MTLSNEDVIAVHKAVQNCDEAEFRRICERRGQDRLTEWACVGAVALVLVLSVFAVGYCVGATVARQPSASCYDVHGMPLGIGHRR
jgi:hypothetical protein